MIDDAPNTDEPEVVTTDAETDEPEVVVVQTPPPAPSGGPVAIVLEHDGPYLLTPPYVEGQLLCWPLDRWNAPAGVAAVLLDPETHKVLGARWRPWQEGDEPTAETAAQMAAQSPKAKRARRCCGK